jgi:hypothetical protein
MDIVMRALPNAYRATHEELQHELDSLRARLVRMIDSSVNDRSAEDAPRPRPGA